MSTKTQKRFAPYFRTNLLLTYCTLFDYLLQDPVDIDGIDSSGNDLAPKGQQPLNEQPSLSQAQGNVYFILLTHDFAPNSR